MASDGIGDTYEEPEPFSRTGDKTKTGVGVRGDVLGITETQPIEAVHLGLNAHLDGEAGHMDGGLPDLRAAHIQGTTMRK
jgi:hypothetical protein